MEKKPEKVSIDDALSETKFGKFNYILILLCGLVMINVVLECVGISFVLPVINCDMDLSFQKKGILGAVGFFGMIFSSHLWGFLADTTGRRKVMRPTLFVGYFVTVLSSFSPNFWTLAVLRFINGFMLCGSSATVYAFLGEFHCNKLRTRALMTSAFISAVAAIFFPLSAWAVINQTWTVEIPLINLTYTPWRMYILLIGSLGLICGLSLFFIPESPKYLLSVGEEEAAMNVLRKMYSINTGQSRDSFKINSIKPDNEEIQRFKVANGKSVKDIVKSMWNQTVPLFMREHCRKTMLACFIQFWTFYTAHGVYMWFPYILNKVMQYTNEYPSTNLDVCDIIYSMAEKTRNAHLNVTTGISVDNKVCDKVLENSTYKHSLFLEFIYVSLFLCIGFLTGKVGRIPTLFTILFVCGACGVLSALVTIPMVAVYFHIILLISGLGTTVVNVIVVDIFPTNLRAMAVCISLMLGRIGSVTGAYVFGTLIEHYCKTSLFVATIPMIACAFLSLLLPSDVNKKKEKNSNVDNDDV
ncbi:synaptic vesicle glycoprotein 2B-like [Episyrphus balteatus]|uniref:synaptic vesicle glycoprotein 2B-like n=1 Tax=Episyrphus balteatus TaxID=286459 RepID=UPI0024866639|nr:synaptic vesicle glycoprotein 2B-like [Episyrphus balteatus]